MRSLFVVLMVEIKAIKNLLSQSCICAKSILFLFDDGYQNCFDPVFSLHPDGLLFGYWDVFTISMNTSAEIVMPKVFSDHMVLQQSSDVNVWGWAEPGEVIQVVGSWDETMVKEGTADESGKWIVALPTPAASEAVGGQTLTVTGSNVVTFDDVLIGEVWILFGAIQYEHSFDWVG